MERRSAVFIGAGNLATNLASALYQSGIEIRQVFSRTESSAQKLSRAVGDCRWTTNLKDVDCDADLTFVALTDAALMELLPMIAEGKQRTLLVHTAGTIPINIWQNVLGAERYGVFYPMQTFSKQRQVSWEDIPIFIESNSAEDTELLKSLASLLSRGVYETSSEQRRALHIAAVFASNFANYMYSLSADILEKHGLPFSVMLPLIDETARKVHSLSPHDAQTGPAVRGDKNVMKKHLDMLDNDPDMQRIYRLLSENIQKNR